MKTNSLRIGNYVLHAGKVIAVPSVFPKGINAHTDRITGKVSYIPADRIDPIPLSTDMLQRLGMRRNAVRWVKYGVDNLYVDRAVDNIYISIGRLGERVCQVQFVHQLQNMLSGGWAWNSICGDSSVISKRLHCAHLQVADGICPVVGFVEEKIYSFELCETDGPKV